MENRSLLIITISLGILVAVWLAVIPQHKRYLNENELQQLVNRLRDFVVSLSSGYRVFYRRDPVGVFQSQDWKGFLRALLPVELDLAPFIGRWTALEEPINLYPSSIKG